MRKELASTFGITKMPYGLGKKIHQKLTEAGKTYTYEHMQAVITGKYENLEILEVAINVFTAWKRRQNHIRLKHLMLQKELEALEAEFEKGSIIENELKVTYKQ